MTCVLALKTSKGIWMGGDSFCGNEDIFELTVEPKVSQVGPVGIGIGGGLRPESLISVVLEEETAKSMIFDEKWLKREFIESLRETFEERGAIHDDGGTHKLPDSEYIIVLGGKIYYLEEDFSIWQPQANYAVIGSNRAAALGSLYSNVKHGRHEEDPEGVVRDALEASEAINPFVRRPFVIIRVQSKETTDRYV